MLPIILSDNICSLLEKKDRFVFVCDIIIDSEYNILKYEFKNALINVGENLFHKTENIAKNETYKKLQYFTKKLNKVSKYIDMRKNSSDIVAYYMVLMNYLCATEMKNLIPEFIDSQI